MVFCTNIQPKLILSPQIRKTKSISLLVLEIITNIYKTKSPLIEPVKHLPRTLGRVLQRSPSLRRQHPPHSKITSICIIIIRTTLLSTPTWPEQVTAELPNTLKKALNSHRSYIILSLFFSQGFQQFINCSRRVT